MNESYGIGVSSIVLVLAVWFCILRFNTWLSQRRLHCWAAERNIIILEEHLCWFLRGPFSFRFESHGSRYVYRLVLRFSDGHESLCWASCSTALFSFDPVIIRGIGPRGFEVQPIAAVAVEPIDQDTPAKLI